MPGVRNDPPPSFHSMISCSRGTPMHEAMPTVHTGSRDLLQLVPDHRGDFCWYGTVPCPLVPHMDGKGPCEFPHEAGPRS